MTFVSWKYYGTAPDKYKEGKKMKFEEALAELRKGKKLIRPLIDGYVDKNDPYQLTIQDMCAEDWEVLEEHGKTFPEVFEAFKEGKNIKRRSWDFYISPICSKFINCDDLLANDWEIIE